jgi:hypothetical protein
MTLHISLFTLIAVLCILLLIIYIAFYIFFLSAVKREERALLDIFLRKISKVPALIEVMRPYIVKPEAFDPITRVHTMTIIESSDSLYDILAHNASLQNEFLFLMKLSQHAAGLQKHEYFLYIRDFIISYERDMKSKFLSMNQVIQNWNRFVRIKNMTLVGYLLPGSQRSSIM